MWPSGKKRAPRSPARPMRANRPLQSSPPSCRSFLPEDEDRGLMTEGFLALLRVGGGEAELRGSAVPNGIWDRGIGNRAVPLLCSALAEAKQSFAGVRSQMEFGTEEQVRSQMEFGTEGWLCSALAEAKQSFAEVRAQMEFGTE